MVYKWCMFIQLQDGFSLQNNTRTWSSKFEQYFRSCSSEMWAVSGIQVETSAGSASRSSSCCASASSCRQLNKRSYVVCVSRPISALWVLAACLWKAEWCLKVSPQQRQDGLPWSWHSSLLDATKAENDCEEKEVGFKDAGCLLKRTVVGLRR